MFTTEFELPFRYGDPAGILFFGNIYSLAHDVHEEFIRDAGFTWDEWFKFAKWATPLRYSECNYLAPLYPGEKYTAQVKVLSMGETSLKVQYEFLKNEDLKAKVVLVFAFTDMKFNKIKLPQDVISRFSKYLAK